MSTSRAGSPGSTEPATAPAGEAYWAVTGPADAPPIVFVHGAMMGRSVWHPQIEALAARYRCITVDLPGHGTRRGHRFTLDEAESSVTRAIDEAAGGRAVVVGLSLGGYTSMLVAGAHPERVRGLIIAGSTREPAGVSRMAFQLYGWFLRLTPEPAVRAVAMAWFRRRYGPVLGTAITAGGHFAGGGGRAVLHLARGRFKDRLRAYGGPILVINGAWDLVFRIGASRFLAGVPRVTSQMIPNAGHLSNVDRPDVFTRLIEEFVDSLEP